MEEKKRKAEYQKRYFKTPAGIKIRTINNWKQKGVVSDDWDALYELYVSTTNCMVCDVLFGPKRKCLDHDHITHLYRAVLCQSCNSGNPLDLHRRKTNTSGHSNIKRHGNGWEFGHTKNRKRHTKNFRILEEAVAYKEEYMKSIGTIK